MDATLLSVLACPQCRGKLLLQEKGLVCAPCALLYPFVDTIPVLLTEEAVALSAAEVQALVHE